MIVPSDGESVPLISADFFGFTRARRIVTGQPDLSCVTRLARLETHFWARKHQGCFGTAGVRNEMERGAEQRANIIGSPNVRILLCFNPLTLDRKMAVPNAAEMSWISTMACATLA